MITKQEHIHCSNFGMSDITNESCQRCQEMEPYQWHKCQDASRLNTLKNLWGLSDFSDREAIMIIEDYEQRRYK